MLTLIGSILRIFGGIFANISGSEQARYQAEGAVGVAAAEGMASVERTWWFVALLIPLFAGAYLPWLWKAAFYDKVWMGGTTSTDPLNGALGWGFNIVLTGLFLQAGINAMVRR